MSEQDKERVRKGFNRLSPAYDLLARIFFGRKLEHSQTSFLTELKKCRTALILGGGTGLLLSEMLRMNIAAHYVYVDISDKMIAKAQKRTAGRNNMVEFTCGSYPDIPNKQFDLVVTPYVLDCFSEKELGAVMKALSSRTAPGAEWLFVDFHVPEKGGMNLFARFTVRSLYVFFNAVCRLGVKKLPDFDRHFQQQGFAVKKEKQFLKGMLLARIYSWP